MYTQCDIEYECGYKETAFIPDSFATKGRSIIVGDKKLGNKAKVVVVYMKTDRNVPLYNNDWSKAHKRSDI